MTKVHAELTFIIIGIICIVFSLLVIKKNTYGRNKLIIAGTALIVMGLYYLIADLIK
jgi:hypothetical protein